MEKLVEQADDIKKAEREAFILNFIPGLLFFIPTLGSAAGAVGMGALRDILSLIGTVGEAGLLVYSIVEDPDSAFMAVFAGLAGAAIGRGGWKDAADARRRMKSGECNSLGPVKDKSDWIDDIRGGSKLCPVR